MYNRYRHLMHIHLMTNVYSYGVTVSQERYAGPQLFFQAQHGLAHYARGDLGGATFGRMCSG